MSEIIEWIRSSPLGVVAFIAVLMVLFALFAAFYELRTRRMFPDRPKRKPKKKS